MKARLPKGMGGGPQNMQAMLKQAQQMQTNIENKKAELEEKEYVVSSGGGMVEVTVSGKREIKAIGINPEVVDPEDVEMLEDMLIAALNEAMRQVEEEEERERLARREARRREQERRVREERRREEALQRRRELRHAQARVRFSVAITMLMMTVLTAAIIGYVRLLSSVTVSSRKISALETQIEKQKTLNDQRLEEIDASINMDEIRSIAINELGMKYADEDQIKTYSSQADDYVHQVAEVGN